MNRVTDPTLTATLRKRLCGQCNARFERIRREVLAAFSLGDYTDQPWPFADPVLLGDPNELPQGGGLLGNAAKTKKKKPKAGYKRPKLTKVTGAPSILGPESEGTGYVYQRNESNVHNFTKWLDKLINQEILEPTITLPNKWLSKGLGTAYVKGVTTTRAKAAKQLAATPVKLLPNHPFNNAAHIERARMIYLRNFNDMQGVTDAMKTQMRRILAEGIMRGMNSNEIGDLLADRVDKIGKVRGRLIARTEVVETHQQAAINEAELLEAETGYEINMEWSTCRDGRERKTHADRDGKVYTKEKVRTLIGEPNCRCSVNPHVMV